MRNQNGAININWNSGGADIKLVTLTGAATFTFSATRTGEYTLMVRTNSIARAVTWMTTLGVSLPSLITSTDWTLLKFYWNGQDWIAL